MGCKCRNNPRLITQQQLRNRKKSRKPEVTQSVLEARREICRECPFSTKRNKKFNTANYDVLGPMSQCKKANKNLHKALKDPKFSCPIENFDASEPKVRK